MFDGFKAMRRVNDLEERLGKLQRDFQALELEWTSAYDKLRSMMQRVAKRAEVVEKGTAGESAGLPPEGDTLSIRQRDINARILARRNRQGVA